MAETKAVTYTCQLAKIRGDVRTPGAWIVAQALVTKIAEPVEGVLVGDQLSLVGALGPVTYGDEVDVIGVYAQHPKWGRQIKAVSEATVVVTESVRGLQRFLSQLPQIGPKRAQQIVGLYNGDLAAILAAIEHHPEDIVNQIPGITNERAAAIQDALLEQKELRDVLLYLTQQPLPAHIQRACIDLWGSRAASIVREDPYAIMAAGASFAVADQYGAHRELPRNAPQRLGALAWQLSRDIADSGSTIAYPADDVVDKFRRMNGVSDPELFDAVLAHGRQNAWAPGTQTVKRVQMPQLDPAQAELVAPWLLSHWESSVAKHLTRIVNGADKLPPCKLRAEDNVFEGMTPSAGQLQAVENFLKNPVSIITGLPGTGKTAVTKAICNLARINGLRMTICAPTGKAAQVAKKATGVPAYTIHRLLGIIGGGGPDAPAPVLHNEDNKLPVAVLIVDEMSMVFVELLHLLLQAVAVGTRVVFVGDNDQLPSIGPGRCLHDMISSNAIPFVALNEIFRTQKSSPIPYWARDVRDGRMPQLTNQVDENGDGLAFVDIERAMPPGKHDPATIAATAASFIVKAVTDTIPSKKRGGVTSYLDVTVLSPQRNGDCGVNTLNQQIQEAINPLLEGRLTATIAYDHLARTGDPIIQGSNDYKLMLVNGEVGRVVAVGKDLLNEEWKDKPRHVVTGIARTMDFVTVAPDSVRVTHANGVKLIAEFPTGGTAGPRFVGFSASECRKLDLAYALTVHKAQGSSAKVIVMPVVSQHAFMLTRKLLYTGATRAERYLLLVGMPLAVAGAVANTRDSQRRTTLVSRINGIQSAEEKDDA